MKELELSTGPEREAFILSLLDQFINEQNGRPVSDTKKDVFMVAKDKKGDPIRWSDAETLFNSLASVGGVQTIYVESTECPAHALAGTDNSSLFALSYLVEGFIDGIKAGDENIEEYGRRLMAFLCAIILPCTENVDASIRLRDRVQAKLHKLYRTVVTENNLCHKSKDYIQVAAQVLSYLANGGTVPEHDVHYVIKNHKTGETMTDIPALLSELRQKGNTTLSVKGNVASYGAEKTAGGIYLSDLIKKATSMLSKGEGMADFTALAMFINNTIHNGEPTMAETDNFAIQLNNCAHRMRTLR